MQKLRRRLYKYLPIIKTVLLLLIICLLAYLLIFRLLPLTFRFLKSLTKISRQSRLRNTNGQINILFLGAGGLNHAAPDLTDSLIFASIRQKNGETVLLSIPRDIWVDSMKTKINAVYHYGEEKKKGGGLILTKAIISDIFDQPIHYAILVDFEGFVRAVDLVGGLEIEVERSFDDYKYPIPGMEEAEPEELRYEHLHFDAGVQHLDGERALKYIRSRYAEGEEGTDFARSKRQQRFLLAFKNKLFSAKTLLSLKKIKELSEIFGDSLEVDIKEEEYPEFLKLALKIKNAKVKNYVLDENLLYHPKEKVYGQWVLLPKEGSWKKTQEHVKNLLQ